MLITHFTASRLPANNGYTWTLATRLGEMLHEAEARYGSRDMTWTILGVEFGPDVPQLWYPGERHHIAIQLAPSALDSERQACYQLAHECIHLLGPAYRQAAPVIEEGLATVYSEDFVRRHFNW